MKKILERTSQIPDKIAEFDEKHLKQRTNHAKYWLTITDPAVEDQYIKKNLGEYPVEEKNAFLCVSLGEPHEGYRYKLVAGIIIV